MSEEKKELNRVEERLKELSKCELFLDNILIKDKTARQILVSSYNKLKRQQKEIEVYKEHYENMKWYYDNQKDNLIHKDKIREKIKHYNNELEHIENGEEFENEKPMYYWGKVALEELLEEK